MSTHYKSAICAVLLGGILDILHGLDSVHCTCTKNPVWGVCAGPQPFSDASVAPIQINLEACFMRCLNRHEICCRSTLPNHRNAMATGNIVLGGTDEWYITPTASSERCSSGSISFPNLRSRENLSPGGVWLLIYRNREPHVIQSPLCSVHLSLQRYVHVFHYR